MDLLGIPWFPSLSVIDSSVRCWKYLEGGKNDSKAADSAAEPIGEAGEGQLYDGGVEEGGHAGQDDSGAKVLDGLANLQLLDQLLFVHVLTKAEEMLWADVREFIMAKKYEI